VQEREQACGVIFAAAAGGTVTGAAGGTGTLTLAGAVAGASRRPWRLHVLQQDEKIRCRVYDAKFVARSACVEHTVGGLDGGAHGERGGPVEYRQRSFVCPAPRLIFLTEERGHTLDVYRPCRVQACVVQVRQAPDGRGEVLRVMSGAVKEIRMFFRVRL